MNRKNVLGNLIVVILISLMVNAFAPPTLGQTGANPNAAPPFVLSDPEGKSTTKLESYYAGAKAVVVFFIRVDPATQDQGLELARHLESEYKGKWEKIPAKVLIVASGDPDAIRKATQGITLPVLRGTDTVFQAYDVVTLYTLCVICVEGVSSGVIIALFDAPADIQSEKVDAAVQSCALSDYIIEASFDDKAEKNVFKKPDGSLLTNSEIFTSGIIDYDFSTDKQVGGSGTYVKISFPGKSKGRFGIGLFNADLSQAGYFTMWILGQTGAEQFYIAIEDGNGVANQLLVSDYIRVQQSRWQRVSIPLRHFSDGKKARPTSASAKFSPLDFKAVSNVSLQFDPSFGEATIYIDSMRFHKWEAPEPIPTTPVQGEIVSGEISIAIREAPRSGVYPGKGVIKGIVKGLDASDVNKYRVVIYSETDQFYVQPFEDNPYTSIRRNGEWSANIFLANASYAALLVKQTGSGWPMWPSPLRRLPTTVDGVEIIDMDVVEPGFKLQQPD